MMVPTYNQEPPVTVNLPVVVDAHTKPRTLGAVIVELAIVEPWLALTHVGVGVRFATFLGEIE